MRAAIDGLITVAAPSTEGAALLYECLTEVSGTRITFDSFSKSTAYKGWVRHSSNALAFIDETFPAAKKAAKKALTKHLLSLLASDLHSKNVPVSLGTLITNLERLAQVFDTAYPGYRSSGLAHLILKAMGNKRE